MFALQRSAGNHAVARLLQASDRGRGRSEPNRAPASLLARDTRTVPDSEIADPAASRLPPAPTITASDGSFTAMGESMRQSLKGPAKLTPPASGFAGANNNLVNVRNHAQAEHTYYSTRADGVDAILTGGLNKAFADVALRDMKWAEGVLADVRVTRSATSSWLALAQTSNDAWGELVKHATAMGMEVSNAPATGLEAASNPGAKGEQTIDASQVQEAGTGLAMLAKQAGVGDGPDSTGLQAAMTAYTAGRDELANKERGIVGTLNKAKTQAIANSKAAAESKKAECETVAAAVGALATGVSLAIGGAAFTEGKVGGAAIDEGAVSDVTRPAETAIKEPATDANAIVGKAKGVLTFPIQLKINEINRQIGAYDAQLAGYQQVDEAQATKQAVGEYIKALHGLQSLAGAVEKQRAEMERKIVQWGERIDAERVKSGKAPKGSEDAAEAAQLLAKIRGARSACDGAVEATAGGSPGSLDTLFGDLAKQCSEKTAAEDGRRDPRSAAFAIETGRWVDAKVAARQSAAALAARQKQLAALETGFLTTFVTLGTKRRSGSQVGPTY